MLEDRVVKVFDPFKSRLCREIRNQLSESLLAAIEKKMMEGVIQTAARLKQQPLEPSHINYIDLRLARYSRILKTPDRGPIFMACQLWNEGLFFECHEWLEPLWINSMGDEKKMLQALIRSAGVYVLMNSNQRAGAEKSAQKAASLLMAQKKNLDQILLPDCTSDLIQALKALDPSPPELIPCKEKNNQPHGNS